MLTSAHCQASEAMTVEVIDVAVASVTATAAPASALAAAGTALPAALPLVGTSALRVRHWNMGHVEQVLGPYSGNFTLTFIPKLINLVGNGASGPWRLFGLDLPGAMNDLALQVWPNLTNLEIVPRRPIYEVACISFCRSQCFSHDIDLRLAGEAEAVRISQRDRQRGRQRCLRVYAVPTLLDSRRSCGPRHLGFGRSSRISIPVRRGLRQCRRHDGMC